MSLAEAVSPLDAVPDDPEWEGWYYRGSPIPGEPSPQEMEAAVAPEDVLASPDPTMADLVEHLRRAIFKDDRDGLWIVDCNAKGEWGTVGEGKTNLELQLAKDLQQPPPESEYPRLAKLSGMPEAEVRSLLEDIPAFDPKWQVVYRDEYRRWLELIRDLSPGMVIVWEEIASGLARTNAWQARKPVIDTFKECRKLGLVTVGSCPRVMDLDAYLIFDRVQRVFRMQGRTKCEVFVRNGFVNPKKDIWGHRQAVVEGITKCHPVLWGDYEADAIAKLQQEQMLKAVER